MPGQGPLSVSGAWWGLFGGQPVWGLGIKPWRGCLIHPCALRRALGSSALLVKARLGGCELQASVLLRLCAVLQDMAQVLRLPRTLCQKLCSAAIPLKSLSTKRVVYKGRAAEQIWQRACKVSAIAIGSRRGKDGIHGFQVQSGLSPTISTIWATSTMQIYHSQDRWAFSFTGTPRDYLGHAEVSQLGQRGHLLLDAWHHAHYRGLLDDWQLGGHAPDGRGLLAARA